jgi:hypothetical protein
MYGPIAGWIICIAVLLWGHLEYTGSYDVYMLGGITVFFLQPPAMAAYLPHLIVMGVVGMMLFQINRFFSAGRTERRASPIVYFMSGAAMALLLDAWKLLDFMKPAPH